jgi:hypothetical protein
VTGGRKKPMIPEGGELDLDILSGLLIVSGYGSKSNILRLEGWVCSKVYLHSWHCHAPRNVYT